MDLDKLAKPFLKGIRPYKPGKPIEQAQREKGVTHPIIKLASNENPYPPDERIKKAVVDAIDETNRYPESGAPGLTEKLAHLYRVEPDEVFVSNGTNEILDLLVRAYVDSQENCVFSQLSFVIYKLICMQCGVGFIEVPHRDYTHDLGAMAEALDAKTKIVFICNPNNPTGTYNNAAELEAFLARVPDHTLIVMDEAYYEFVNVSDYPQSLVLRRNHERLIVLRTFSKFYSLAGIRVGYAIADRRVVDILNKMRQPFNVNRLAQVAAFAALDCAGELKAFVAETVRERDAMRKRILGMDCVCPPSQTNFLFVVPPRHSRDVCGVLEEEGIIVRPMAPFGGPDNSFRVNTGTPEENRLFLDAFTQALAKG